jgi:conjugal transfer pilin signal peptidase TrbI
MSAVADTLAMSRPRRALAWWAAGACSLLGDVRRRWTLYAAVALVWLLAVLRVFIYETPLVPILFNWTASLPYRVAYVDYGAGPPRRGQYIIYSFAGEAGDRDYPGLKSQPFFKRVVGMAGDRITVVGRQVFVNGVYVGTAKTHAFDHKPLQPIEPGVIPAGYLYAQGNSPDSFDSRYRSSGLVKVSQVVATVRPLF